LAKKRNYEKLFYLKTIRRGQTVLDLGANRGFFAYLFAKLTGSKGKVHCFEPIPENLKSLKPNVSMFPWVEIHPFAVGDKKREAEMHYSKNELEKAALQPEAMQHCDTTTKVNVVALDQYMKEVSRAPIHFIKCDVEGHELKVLKGMNSLLRKFHPKLSIEITVSGNERKEIFKLLMENNYDHFQKIEKNYPMINPTEEIPKDSYFYLYAASTLVT
jgi:FkbM family methyltransferase